MGPAGMATTRPIPSATGTTTEEKTTTTKSTKKHKKHAKLKKGKRHHKRYAKGEIPTGDPLCPIPQ